MPIQELTYKGVEYLHAAPQNSGKPPILLVHGAYNNGYLWQTNFIPYFLEKGYPVYAIHLKKQHKVNHIKTLFSYSLNAYVNKLALLVERIGEKPVLVGHSMGGLVVQKYLSVHSEHALGACLLASLPVFGMKNTLLGMLLDPYVLLQYTILTLYPAVVQHGPPPKGLLSKRVTKEDHLRQFTDSIQRESGIALTNCLNPKIKAENVSKVPLLIYGAEYDNLALPKDVERMGKIYGQPVKIFPDTGHFLMMEPEAEEIGEGILSLTKIGAVSP